jgi:hypothetical protein
MPDVAAKLEQARKARHAWLKSKRGRLALSAAGVATGAAGAALAVVAAPLTRSRWPSQALDSRQAPSVPGMEWLLDWRDGKRSVQENGLHHLLSIPQPE